MVIRGKNKTQRDVLENGARRQDVWAAFCLAAQRVDYAPVTVSSVMGTLEASGGSPLTVGQVSDELYRLFECGNMCCYVNGGKYYYFFPPFLIDGSGKPCLYHQS